MKKKLFKKRFTRRLFSAILTLAIIFPLVTMNSLTVYATDAPGTEIIEIDCSKLKPFAINDGKTGFKAEKGQSFTVKGVTIRSSLEGYIELWQSRSWSWSDYGNGGPFSVSLENGTKIFKIEITGQSYHVPSGNGWTGTKKSGSIYSSYVWQNDDGAESVTIERKPPFSFYSYTIKITCAQAPVAVYNSNATHHWYPCVVNDANREYMYDKATHVWDDGKCGTCGYECQHGGATSEICGVCGKDLDAEDGVSEDGVSEDGVSEDSVSEDSVLEDGVSEDSSSEDSSSEDSSSEDSSSEDSASEDSSLEDSVSEDGISEDNAALTGSVLSEGQTGIIIAVSIIALVALVVLVVVKKKQKKEN